MYESFQMKRAAMGGAVLSLATLISLKRFPTKAQLGLGAASAVVAYFTGVQYLLDGPAFVQHVKRYRS